MCFACWSVGLFVALLSFCRRSFANLDSRTHRGCKPDSMRTSLVPSVSPSLGWFIRLCFICLFVRVGEAMNPGPCGVGEKQHWTLGLCNPSGLNSKIDQCAFLDGDVWLISESHLTDHGLQRFKKGMQHLKSDFKYFTPGFSCPSRGASDVGKFTGVLAMSKLPLRSLPAHFDTQLYATSRIQVVGIAVEDWWVTAGLVYGYPDSVQFPNRTYMTECLVDEVVQRVVFQSSGPRLVAGDFNHGPNDLEQFQILRQAGFAEIQEIGLSRWGRQIQPTCGGTKNIDQIWLSAELQSILLDFHIRDDDWAGHSAIQCVFASQNTPMVRYEWHVPSSFPWPEVWTPQLHCNWQADLTEQYASLWYQLESQAVALHNIHGSYVPDHSLGRAKTLQSVAKWSTGSPCKKAREGGLNPDFYGQSLRHCQMFKQLRRLEALRRAIRSDSHNHLHHLKKVELWQAIRRAAGFPQGFGRWWTEHSNSDLVYLPTQVPSQAAIGDIFEQFHQFVRTFEAKLIRSRIAGARQRRKHDLTFVFRDCQQAKPEKVDTIVISKTAEVENVLPEDESVTLTQPCSFDPGVPFICNGKSLPVIIAEHDQIWTESCRDLVPGDIIRQDKVLSTDHDILTEFCRVWTPRWQKSAHVLDSQWQQIMDFTTRAFNPISWQSQQWNVSLFQQALKLKKSSAATGPDGVSRKDLLAMPVEGHQAMTDMLGAIETQHAWPRQLTKGFVNSLFKNKGDGSVDSYRPVTVFPLPYRIWSSVRAKEAMQSLMPHLPRSVVGGVPNRQAKEVWIEVAEIIEAAIVGNDPIQGLVVDICRAFNALPRVPLWHFLCVLQFPLDILHTWAHFVSVQTRMFRVRSSTGGPIGSNVGYPEGCALSVVAMTLVDWLLDRWLFYATHGNHCLYAYVDDWHVTYDDNLAQDEVWQSLSGFATAMDLQVDAEKSFAWSSHSEQRKQMRAHPDLSVVLAAKDLGAHHNFCRKPGNVFLITRLRSLPKLWTRLAVCQSPIRLKLQALVQMAWPKAFYGVSVVHVGSCHYKVLRTGAVRGLRSCRVGTNPLLHLSAAGMLHDPEAFVLYQTFREYREVGNRNQSKLMLSLLQAGCAMVPRNGPGYILWERLHRLGWQVTSEGGVVDTISPFCVFSVHRDELLFRMVHAWPRVIAAELFHRPSFAGIQSADIPALKVAMFKFGEADREFLKCALDGTLYIDVGRTKQEREGPRVCQFCQAPDSFFHRLWECSHFESCRSQFPYHSLLPSLPACLTNHGWPVYPPEWLKLLSHFADIRLQIHINIPVVASSHEVLELFTDGACAHPTLPKLRYASYAVTRVVGGIGSLAHEVVGVGHVPGIVQTAYRAELFAMIRAFEVAGQLRQTTRIWTDNLAVCRRARRILAGWTPKPNMAHCDLLERLVELTLEGNLGDSVSIVKVVSHASLFEATDEIQHWAFWHNHLVDFAAERTNSARPSQFWQLWQDAYDATVFSESLHYEILKVVIRVARYQQTPGGPGSYVDPEVTVDTPESALLPCVQHAMSTGLLRMYGQVNMQHMNLWWNRVGEPALAKGGKLYWIAGIHLYIDFFWTTNFYGLISPRFGQWFSDPSDIPELALTMASRTTMFLRAWNAYMKDRGQLVPKKLVRPHSSVVACWVQSYHLPWSRQRLDAVDQMLMDFYGRQVVRSVQFSEMVDLPKHPEDHRF